ncbi:MAG: hypothetical protein JSV50_19760, partial [Desulfobacteraceae bacterium]
QWNDAVFCGPSERDTHGPFGTIFKQLNCYPFLDTIIPLTAGIRERYVLVILYDVLVFIEIRPEFLMPPG